MAGLAWEKAIRARLIASRHQIYPIIVMELLFVFCSYQINSLKRKMKKKRRKQGDTRSQMIRR
jgi:hypothetical protein